VASSSTTAIERTQKVIGVAGAVLVGFVLVHLIGSLQIYGGAERLNGYAAFMHGIPALVWAGRGILAVSLTVLLVCAVRLTWLKRRAGQRHAGPASMPSTLASRTMMFTGPLVLAFIVFHILQFTSGIAGTTDVDKADVFQLTLTAFSSVPYCIVYVVGMLLLGLHLHHGVRSIFASLGYRNEKTRPWQDAVSTFLVGFIVLANLSIPVAVLSGIVA
jgi:succinate dehydrogenase / fumarate reductase cytochrome b subunit